MFNGHALFQAPVSQQLPWDLSSKEAAFIHLHLESLYALFWSPPSDEENIWMELRVGAQFYGNVTDISIGDRYKYQQESNRNHRVISSSLWLKKWINT